MNLKKLLQKKFESKILLKQYVITYKILPKGVCGFIFKYNETHFIIINKRLSHYKRKKTLQRKLAYLELKQL